MLFYDDPLVAVSEIARVSILAILSSSKALLSFISLQLLFPYLPDTLQFIIAYRNLIIDYCVNLLIPSPLRIQPSFLLRHKSIGI